MAAEKREKKQQQQQRHDKHHGEETAREDSNEGATRQAATWRLAALQAVVPEPERQGTSQRRPGIGLT